MRIALFVHSLLSDWNHGNAHFLRGVATELVSRGHDVRIFEPRDAWSLQNLLADDPQRGEKALGGFHRAYPALTSERYDLAALDLDEALDGAGLVIVHEWNDHGLVRRIGEHRRTSDYRLLFHDTHHRSVTAPDSMAAYDLSGYDGVLAFGGVIRDLYLDRGWAERAWTWHEAADTRVFHPIPGEPEDGDLVWIGNWGDGERTAELEAFLLAPAADAGLPLDIYGVRYPEEAKRLLARNRALYRGWLPNARAPEVFARHLATVHVPRRFYVEHLPGIPTIRVFEALACGIPLVSAPWSDAEDLFRPGRDYLVAKDRRQMTSYLKLLRADADVRAELVRSGLETIRARHTCAHRVDELMTITARLAAPARWPA
ncbi:MAG TPA: glycosyltransferase, partial [Thermoanaerobaculia bacterium]|nr:glycosyltransferase [Thermoanaerobaculia bacterium]